MELMEFMENLIIVILFSMLVSISKRGIKLNKREKIMSYIALALVIITTIPSIMPLLK